MHTNDRGIGSSNLPGVARLAISARMLEERKEKEQEEHCFFVRSVSRFVRARNSRLARTLPYPITLSDKNAAVHRAFDGIAGILLAGRSLHSHTTTKKKSEVPSALVGRPRWRSYRMVDAYVARV